MKVTENHFVGNFLNQEGEFSGVEIPTELSFKDRECIFNQLSFPIPGIIGLESHFLTVSTPDNVVLPGANGDNRVGMEIFPDQPMNRFRIISSVHDITIGLSCFVTLSEQFTSMSGIMDPAFRSDEAGNCPLIGINRDRSFLEMFSELTGSF